MQNKQKRTTMTFDKETRDSLRAIKQKYGFSSMDSVIQALIRNVKEFKIRVK